VQASGANGRGGGGGGGGAGRVLPPMRPRTTTQTFGDAAPKPPPLPRTPSATAETHVPLSYPPPPEGEPTTSVAPLAGIHASAMREPRQSFERASSMPARSLSQTSLNANSVREIVGEVVAEMLKPAAARMRALEEKVAYFERLAAEAENARASVQPSFAPLSITPMMSLPPLAAAPNPGNVDPAYAQAAAAVAWAAAVPAALQLPAAPLVPAVPPAPQSSPKSRMPSINFDGVIPRNQMPSLAFDEFPGMNGSARRRNTAIVVVLVILLGVAGLLASMIASRSAP
jgi:hypothetical protein